MSALIPVFALTGNLCIHPYEFEISPERKETRSRPKTVCIIIMEVVDHLKHRVSHLHNDDAHNFWPPSCLPPFG